ncbi:MAG: transglycosylase SLT domain-containing protein [Cyanobacteria bacterium P01_A01_bin.114]
MWKRLKDKWPFFALAGLSALSLGMIAAVLQSTDSLQGAQSRVQGSPSLATAAKPSAVLQLAIKPAAERTEALSTLAANPNPSLDNYRARYLLATDLLNQGNGKEALPFLEGLEADYEAMAPYVMLKRGQAQAAAGDRTGAAQTWQQLIDQHATHPAVAEALYELGQYNQQAWDQLLTTLPDHPRSVEVALKRLAASAPSSSDGSTASPDQTAPADVAKSVANEKDLLLIVAAHGLYRSEYEASLDRLVANYGAGLTPEQWQTIGFGYWEIQRYGKAGKAYAKAPGTPVTRYRAARGAHLVGENTTAIATYRQLAQAFPSAPETATGLLKLSDLLPSPQALPVLDQVIAQFPDSAGEALLKRSERLENMQSPTSTKNAKASILSQYSQSDAAAQLRLKNAKGHAEKGDHASALKWAQQLVEANPDIDLAAEAGFWAGKWAIRQQQQNIAQKAFEQVIRAHPESYFAWRSAVHLGWDVGDFQDVRHRDPEITLPAQRLTLPAGSDTLQELYRLGQDQDAWRLWQLEFENEQAPTVAEQFTDGVLRLGVGDNLDGIFMLSSLAWRDTPAEQEDYQALKQTPTYWEGVYPFPYAEPIQTWAEQRQLNPLLVTALIRQESRFEPQIRSVVGATGLMQLMPDTADWVLYQTGETDQLGDPDLDLDSELENPETNIKLGTWYLDFTHEEYDNHSLFAVASYNAGPGNVSAWIEEGGYSNADEFVDAIPFPETKGYVESVFGGYWNYLRLYNPEISRRVAKYTGR